MRRLNRLVPPPCEKEAQDPQQGRLLQKKRAQEPASLQQLYCSPPTRSALFEASGWIQTLPVAPVCVGSQTLSPSLEGSTRELCEAHQPSPC
mmetsp:Transcript_35456/g.67907  ORF Transcript_35456/g.67907 Transcript_35456/m.67907 type:complete len:92 (-) Transcript_35456:665-940(-)